jgi:ribonuclease R
MLNLKRFMGKQKQKSNKKFGVQLEEDIRGIFRENPKAELNYKQVAGFLEITDKVLRKLVFDTLLDLAESGYLKQTQRGKFKIGKRLNLIEGTVDVARRGNGFVITDKLDQDIMIPAKHMVGVLHGDRVLVELKTSRRANRTEGRIVEVLDRDKRKFVGTLEKERKHAFVVPDDFKMNVDFYIPAGKEKNAVSGEKVIVKITDWPESAKSPFAEVVEVLGSVESNDVQMRSILASSDIKYEFPDEVIRQANLIDMQLDPAEIEKRRDFRDTLTFTIDPIDAKDFDDAISVEQLDNGLVRVGVHIADVAHYVPQGSALDIEAKERGNSVYLVDRVIPMLPEHLSNGVCSLRPNEEKFVFSAVFDLTEQGEIKKEWFGKGVINSDRRFTYEEAQIIIETGEGDHAEEITQCDKIAKNLRTERLSKGGLEIVSSELRFELDDKGMPINVYKKTSKDANKLIEEFMLLANKRVGRFVGDVKGNKKPVPLVYRIHDKPDQEKVEQFAVFVSKFGQSFRFKNDRDIAFQMNALFKKMKDDGNFNMIQQMAIKSMAKAVYDTDNIGHYGLGFEYYAHFTSPIRRYADLLVHRILFDVLNGKRTAYPELNKIAVHISATERKAVDAERSSRKYFQAQYLSDQIGEEFTGFITGITDWGMYVEMHENHCEGMVPLKAIKFDQFYFDEAEYALIGRRSGESFTVGDEVKVRLSRVSLVKKQIDLELLID